jgi:hypothetical protein
MPVNGYTIGSDCTIDVFDPISGGLLTLNGITSFEPRQMTDNSMRRRLDGTVHPLLIPGGWEGTIGLDRLDDAIDRYFSGWEDAYYSGQNMRTGSITETIRNPDGSISQYRYEEVMFRYDNAGTRRGEQAIEISLAFQSARRRKIV